MSNMNRRQSFVDDDDGEDLSLDETSFESTANSSTYLSISSDQTTAVAKSVRDERSNHIDQITSESTDDLIAYPSRSLLIPTYAGESEIQVGEAHSWIDEPMFAYFFEPNRTERSNNQITYPSDDFKTIFMDLLSPVVIRLIFNIIINNVPLGVQDTQTHTMVLPVVNISDREVNIEYENGDTNEDATVYNDDDLIDSTTNEIGDADQMIVTENMATETNDDMRNDFAQDRNCADHNQNELITEDPEPENQNNLNIHRSQTSPRLELTINDNSRDNAETIIPTTPIRTLSTESSEQVVEFLSTLAAPDDNTPTAENPAHLLPTGFDVSQLTAIDRKQSNPFNDPEEADEQKHVS